MNLLAKLERAKGIEPSYAAWEAAVLPLNYARGIKELVPTATRNLSQHAQPHPPLITRKNTMGKLPTSCQQLR